MGELRTDRESGDGIGYSILRIVWSAAWVIVCVFVLTVWSRSYYYDDRCYVDIMDSGLSLESDIGQLHFEAFDGKGGPGISFVPSWHWVSSAADLSNQFGDDEVWACEYVALNSWTIHVPHWFGALFSVALAVLPWVVLIAARGIRWIRGRRLARGGGEAE
jgi:hypothetical protein